MLLMIKKQDSSTFLQLKIHILNNIVYQVFTFIGKKCSYQQSNREIIHVSFFYILATLIAALVFLLTFTVRQ